MELTGLVGQEEADNVGLQLSEHVGTERCSDKLSIENVLQKH